ncbi:hypothetical protein [Hymenobacter radiodurans]|uniref:hypothetical protein n=1 Tax=Hymenobacter radiodurans TaxID=2496028 RepID=UPI0010584ABF|nr:hypothetical protein [Hymenobacter radiodurans]
MRAIRSFYPFLLLLVFLLAMWVMVSFQSKAPTKIMPLGDSITHGNRIYNSYRRPLWHSLQQVLYAVNFVGGRILNKGGLAPNFDFDWDHQGQWG